MIADLSVCLSVPRHKETLILEKIWCQTTPDVDVYTALIDSRHTYKQSGPTFGFDGALHLALRDPASPGITACRQSHVPESVRAAKSLANWLQRIDRNKRETPF